MTACPLCVLGFPDPHTKADWERLATEPELHERWEEIEKKRGFPSETVE